MTFLGSMMYSYRPVNIARSRLNTNIMTCRMTDLRSMIWYIRSMIWYIRSMSSDAARMICRGNVSECSVIVADIMSSPVTIMIHDTIRHTSDGIVTRACH